MHQKLKSATKLFLKLLFVAIALFLVFRKIDIVTTFSLIEKIDLWFFGIALFCSVISLIISGIRSHYYFSAYGLKLSQKYIIFLYFIGTFFNLALPGGIGGDGYKIYHIHKCFQFSKLKAFRVVLYERVNGFFVLCILGFIIFYFSSFHNIAYASLINTALLLLITPCYAFGIKYVLKDKIDIAFRASWYSLFVQLFQLALSISLLYALAPSAAKDVYIDFTLLFVIASILSIIPISVGGIGIRELTFLYGLEFLKDPESLLTLGIAFALSSFLIYTLTALVGLPMYYMIKSVNPSKD